VWWELTIGLVTFLVCTTLSNLSIGDKQASAQLHATQVLNVERALGLELERPLNSWLAEHDTVAAIANYTYAWGYIATTLAAFVYLYLFRPAKYRWGRRSCLLLNVIAAACFALYPVAPPRLTADIGIVDTVVRQHTWGSWGTPMTEGTNQLAALPSLHFALAAWVLFLLTVAGAPRAVRLLGVANVVVTLVVILATGNHYLLDVLAALVLVAVSLVITAPWRRQRSGPDRFYATPSRSAPPNVAGVLVLDSSDVDAAESSVRTEISAAGRRWRQRLERRSWLKPPRWPPSGEPDWSWHIVRQEPVDGAGRTDGVRRLATEVASQPLPEDRPRWRACVVPAANGRGVAIIVVVDRALGWHGWFDTTLKASAIVEDDCRELDAVLDRLSALDGSGSAGTSGAGDQTRGRAPLWPPGV
jgi:diacylglycerol O-acyltransferase / wax synthase